MTTAPPAAARGRSPLGARRPPSLLTEARRNLSRCGAWRRRDGYAAAVMAVDTRDRPASIGADILPRLYDALMWPAERRSWGAGVGACPRVPGRVARACSRSAPAPAPAFASCRRAASSSRWSRRRPWRPGRKLGPPWPPPGRAGEHRRGARRGAALRRRVVRRRPCDLRVVQRRRPVRAFAEARRVLRPEGRPICSSTCTTAGSPSTVLRDVVRPAWRRVAGGCRLDQDTVGLLVGAGLRVERRADHLLGWIVEIEARR